MTRLAEEGFLADETAAVVAAMRGRYTPWLAEVRAVNALLVRPQYEMAIHPESAQEVTCAALYVRTLAHAQAAVLLLERGMAASARAMLRCALDGLFSLGACSRDAKTALSFLDTDQVDRKRRARHLAEVQDPAARAALDKQEIQAILAEAQRNIDDLGAPHLPVRELAQSAGLEDLYLTVYAFLSGAVHSSVADLDQHLQVDAEGRVSALVNEPFLERLDGLLLIAGEVMVSMMRARPIRTPIAAPRAEGGGYTCAFITLKNLIPFFVRMFNGSR